jgi:hypothetical protein
MVRRNELACRDEWSRSLWQPRDSQHSNGDTPFQRPVLGPLPPVLAENLQSVLNGDAALAAASNGEDVLLSEARIISEERESWEPQQRSFPTGHFDPRTAIFRAREAYRERVRAKSAAERQSAGVEAMIGSPQIEDSAPPQAEKPTAGLPDRVPHQLDQNAAGGLPVQTPDADSWLASSVEAEPKVGAPTFAADAPVSGKEVSQEPLASANEFQLLEPEAGWLGTTEELDEVSGPPLGPPDSEEPGYSRARVEVAEREPLPDWYRADLPRVCRTCRDYRPSAEGQRGWCANSWAFTHRRLVLEDDPAPCQSAIGDWWLPVDDVWLVAADVSSHGRATPLLDRLTAKADQQKRRS